MQSPLRTLAAGLAVTLILLTADSVYAQDAGSMDTTKTTPTLVGVLEESDGFATLLKTLEAAALADTLRSEGSYTLFAPTDAAFTTLPEGALKNLLKPASKSDLRAILAFHVVPGMLTGGTVSERVDLKTLNGTTIGVESTGGTVVLTGSNEATVTTTNVEASNGLIHVIDTVLLPPVETAKRESQ